MKQKKDDGNFILVSKKSKLFNFPKTSKKKKKKHSNLSWGHTQMEF